MANNPYAICVVALTPEDGGGFFAFVPDLQGCMADGDTSAEALANCEQAILEWIDAAKETGQHVPEPGSAHKNAVKNREGLLAKIAEQTRMLEQLDGEIHTLKKTLSTLTDRISESQPAWHVDPMPLVAVLRSPKQNAVH